MISILNKINHFFDAAPSILPSLLPYRSEPAETGEAISGFQLKADQGFWEGKPAFISNHNLITEKQLFKKPLVLSFYSPEWKNYGLQQLKTLHQLQKDINLLGGQLLIIADIELRTLKELMTTNGLKLNLYADPGHTLAENLGVYNAADPVYNKISGIDNNVPLLATYIINPARKVTFRYIDNLQDVFPAEELLNTLSGVPKIVYHS
jgi:peroxiredoxin